MQNIKKIQYLWAFFTLSPTRVGVILYLTAGGKLKPSLPHASGGNPWNDEFSPVPEHSSPREWG